MAKKLALVVMFVLGAAAAMQVLGIYGLVAAGLLAGGLIYRQKKEAAARDAVAQILHPNDDSDD